MQPGPQLKTATTESFEGTDNPAARTDPLPGHGRPSRVRSGGAARSSTRRFRPPALCCVLHVARCMRHAACCLPGGRWTSRRRCCRHLLGQQPQLQPHRQPMGVRERVHLQRALHEVLARLEQLAPRERHELRHAVPVCMVWRVMTAPRVARRACARCVPRAVRAPASVCCTSHAAHCKLYAARRTLRAGRCAFHAIAARTAQRQATGKASRTPQRRTSALVEIEQLLEERPVVRVGQQRREGRVPARPPQGRPGRNAGVFLSGDKYRHTRLAAASAQCRR